MLDYLAEIPPEAAHQDWHMTEGKATERFKPYLFVLQKEGLNHTKFSKKIITITEYLFENIMMEKCIDWLKVHYPKDGFFCKGNKPGWTIIQYLEHVMMKVNLGKGYWDDLPRFVVFIPA